MEYAWYCPLKHADDCQRIFVSFKIFWKHVKPAGYGEQDLLAWVCHQPNCDKSHKRHNGTVKTYYDHLKNHRKKVPSRRAISPENNAPLLKTANSNHCLPCTSKETGCCEESVHDTPMDTEIDMSDTDHNPGQLDVADVPRKETNIDYAIGAYQDHMSRLAGDLALLLQSSNIKQSLNTQIMEVICSVVSETVEHVKSQLPVLKECNYSASLMDKFCGKLQNVPIIFRRFKTPHLQKKYFEKNKLYVAPEEKCFGHPEHKVVMNKDGEKEFITEHQTWQYIPIRQSLKAILSARGVLDQMKQWKADAMKPLTGNALYSFLQSPCFRNNPLFMDPDKLGLPIEIYLDELEPCKSLGTKVNVHKTWNIYGRILLAPSRFQSRTYAMFLIAIVNSGDMYNHHRDVVFQRIADDLHELALKPFTVDGEDVYAALAYAIADMPAYGVLFRLRGHGSNTNYCRFCYNFGRDGDQLGLVQEASCQTEFVMRTIDMYNSDLDQLEGMKKLMDELPEGDPDRPSNAALEKLKQKTGYKGRCLLNADGIADGYFHCVTHWSVDWLHDVLEGVVGYEMHWVLTALARDKYVKAQVKRYHQIWSDRPIALGHEKEIKNLETYLDHRIDVFLYGKSDKSTKPLPISTRTNPTFASQSGLKLKGMQKFTLMRLLPLLIGDAIEEDNPYWLFFLDLRKICDMIFSPVWSPEKKEAYEVLYAKHLNDLRNLFPQHSVKPKHHHLIHYGQVAMNSGPILYFSTHIHELKHKTSKNIAFNTNNYKNFPKTCSQRHQIWMAYQWGVGTLYSDTVSDFMGYYSIDPNHSAIPIEAKALLGLGHMCCAFDFAHRVSITGQKYFRNQFLILELCKDSGSPKLFGRIEGVCVFGNQPEKSFALVERYTASYVHHYHCYSITPTTTYDIVAILETTYPHPMDAYKLTDGRTVVIPCGV